MKRQMITWICLSAVLIGMLNGCEKKSQPPVEDSQNVSSTSVENDETVAPIYETTTPEVMETEPLGAYYTVYVQAVEEWDVPYLRAWSLEKGNFYKTWPGEKMEMNEDGWYYATIPADYDNVKVFGQNGNIKTEDEITFGRDIWFTIRTDTYYVDDSEEKASERMLTLPDGYIAQLDGVWERVHLNDGSSDINTDAKVYSEPVHNCTEMTLVMEVEMYNGTNCKDWQIWGRTGNAFIKLQKIHLEAGDGYGSFVVKFDEPVSFDAIAVTPTIPGGYSWSLAFYLTDIWTAQ